MGCGSTVTADVRTDRVGDDVEFGARGLGAEAGWPAQTGAVVAPAGDDVEVDVHDFLASGCAICKVEVDAVTA
jgi:hypothetical protein